MPLPEFKQIVDEAKHQIQEVAAEELSRMQQAGEDFTLIDVREPDEQAKGMIDRFKPNADAQEAVVKAKAARESAAMARSRWSTRLRLGR